MGQSGASQDNLPSGPTSQVSAGKVGLGRNEHPRRFIVQQFVSLTTWVDVDTIEASSAGIAFEQAVLKNEAHRVRGTTYRVSEEALILNVSINLEDVTDA